MFIPRLLSVPIIYLVLPSVLAFYFFRVASHSISPLLSLLAMGMFAPPHCTASEFPPQWCGPKLIHCFIVAVTFRFLYIQTRQSRREVFLHRHRSFEIARASYTIVQVFNGVPSRGGDCFHEIAPSSSMHRVAEG